MKPALYLPNFRDKITVEEIDAFAAVAEELEFDSIWVLDRIAVPEASDRGELKKSFGFISEFGRSLPVSSHAEYLHAMPLVPYLAAITKKIRIGTSVIVTPLRASAVMAAEMATWDQLSRGRINVGIGSGWMPEEFETASAGHLYAKRNLHVRETIEIMKGIWTQPLFEYHGELNSFQKCGFGTKPVQRPHPPLYFGGIGKPEIAAEMISKYGLQGWIGALDPPEAIANWRTAIAGELARLGSPKAIDGLELASQFPFQITKEKTDQTPRGKMSSNLVGTAAQITDNLKRYRDAGLTMALFWPPFSGVTSAESIDHLKRLRQEIWPKIE
ncbi:MAG TPA: LLM class flavin-dependent oxidoreductase [Gammaproteobacteria bacterium]|nr:LLM class flavin-dependent oxidoreductase [Gammaproteobacteria bacterium]